MKQGRLLRSRGACMSWENEIPTKSCSVLECPSPISVQVQDPHVWVHRRVLEKSQLQVKNVFLPLFYLAKIGFLSSSCGLGEIFLTSHMMLIPQLLLYVLWTVLFSYLKMICSLRWIHALTPSVLNYWALKSYISCARILACNELSIIRAGQNKSCGLMPSHFNCQKRILYLMKPQIRTWGFFHIQFFSVLSLGISHKCSQVESLSGFHNCTVFITVFCYRMLSDACSVVQKDAMHLRIT